MKKEFRLFIIFGFLVSLDACPVLAGSMPSADSLLQTAKNNTAIHCNTQHLFYRSTTLIQQTGQAPTSVVQTTEIFKKKPSYFKMVTNDGLQQRVVISVGDGYLYVQDPTSGKFMPIKSPFKIDPFQDMVNSLTDFASADVQQISDSSSGTPQQKYRVTVRGGKLPSSVDHAIADIDPDSQVITHMEGEDATGKQVMDMDATYQKIGTTYHPKHVHVESHAGSIDVSSDMDVLTNEVDKGILDSTFSVK